MPRLQELHPDQQAVLQLLLRRRMHYAELAAGLALREEQVRERALDAVDGLAPDDVAGLRLEDRDRIAEYLLGQQEPTPRLATRKLLATHPPAHAWATLVRTELQPLAAQELPTIPAPETEDTPEAAGGITAAFAALDAGRQRPAGHRADRRTRLDGLTRLRRSPQRAGLALVGVLVVVALLLWVGGVFGGGDDPAATPPTSTTATTAGSSENAKALAMVAGLATQVNFDPPQGATGAFAKARGVGQPQAVQGVPGMVFVGDGFPPMTAKRLYAVWLVGGGKKPVRLGWFSDGSDDTTPTIDKDGKIEQAFFPFAQAGADGKTTIVDPRDYRTMRITRETKISDTPGPTVVSGSLR